MEDVAGYPCFGLVKDGVTVNVEVWDGELESTEENQEIWVQLRGLKPEWCKWGILSQFASAFGIMVDIDWQGLFLNFCEVVRIKIQYKNPLLIPNRSLFEIKKKYYPVSIVAESPVPAADAPDDPSNPGPGGADKQSLTENMDLGNNAASGQRPGTSDAEKGGRKGSSSAAPCKKNADFVQVSANGVFETCNKDTAVSPVGVEATAENLLGWLASGTPDTENCYSLLRDMKLVEDGGHFSLEETEGCWVNGAQHTANEIVASDKRQCVQADPIDMQKSKKSKTWGPVVGTRQSSRLQCNAGKSILELAQENKKKKYLEIPASSTFKGMVADFENPQEMEIDFQGHHASSDRSLRGHGELTMQGSLRSPVGVRTNLVSTSLGPATPPAVTA